MNQIRSKSRYFFVNKILCFLLLISTTISATLHDDHDIHVSICEIDLREEVVQLTIKTYIDDLQVAIGLEAGAELPEGYSSADEMIADYVHSALLIHINNKSYNIVINSIDASREAVWINCDLEIKSASFSNFTLDNSFLTEVHDDQTNIIKVITTSGRKTHKMDGSKKRLVVSLE